MAYVSQYADWSFLINHVIFNILGIGPLLFLLQWKVSQVIMHAFFLFLYNIPFAYIVEQKPDMKVYGRVRL